MNPVTDRRSFVKMSLLAASAPAIIGRALAGSSPSGLAPIRREIFLAANPGESVVATTFYTRPTGVDLFSIRGIMKRSDTVEVAHFSYSADNGRTWQ